VGVEGGEKANERATGNGRGSSVARREKE